MKFIAAILICFFLQGGCVSIVEDISMNALAANDRTLILNACGAISQGGTLCRVTEGQDISAGFSLLLPENGKLLGGELTVLFKDIEKSFAINSSITEVKFEDVYGGGTWHPDTHDGELVLLAKIRYVDENGVEQVVRALGFVRVFVLKPGYSPMPLDSGYVAFEKEFKCRVQYSTSGRSAVKCSK